MRALWMLQVEECEGVRKDSRREGAKRKLWGEARDGVLLEGGGDSRILLEGSHAMPACLSGKDRM
jgi:hypothetical protein